jgi:benzoate-CoA ligase
VGAARSAAGEPPAADWSQAVEPFNACVYLLDRHVAAGNGGRVAFLAEDDQVTYAELHELVRRYAAGLRSLGVRPEERVALVLLDSVEFAATFLAALRIGAIPLPLNPLLPGREHGLTVAEARARLAVISAERAAGAADLVERAPELEHVIVAGEGDVPALPRGTVRGWEELAAGDPAAGEPYPTWEDSPGFWLCTSGTTGRPKLAMHRHVDLQLPAEGYAREVLGIGPDDRCFSVAPLFHAYGLGNALGFPLSVGASAILERARPPKPARVAEVVREGRPTLFFSVPTFYAALLAAELPEDTFASVRHGVSAGEALPAELFTRFRERFGVEILDGIGSTEMTHIYVSNRAGRCRPGSSGTVVGGYEVRLKDEEGDEVSRGTPGQLWVRGASAATGYWCRADATRQAFQGEWFRSGDMYVESDDGFFTYLGRADDMFKVGGEWVAPAEVEAVLIEHPDVLEAVVVGAKRADGLVEAVACVVPAGERRLDPEVLIEHCRGRLAGFKRPRRVLVMDELPKTATGKIQRAVLRDRAGAA